MYREKTITDRKALWILTALMLAGCVFIFHNYIFGNETLVFGDVGSDTKQQYIMWYNGVANRLRSGTFSLWDFHSGLGVNQIDLNITGPFTLLTYLCGFLFGPDKIAYCMVYIQILKVILSGFSCYLLLSVFDYEPTARIIGAFLYAFNGYLMVWGQHYMMGSIVVFLPLLVWCVEKTVRDIRWALGLAAASALVILNSYYQGYMSILAVAVYVTIRVLLYDTRPFGKRFALFLIQAFSMAFGLVMAAINLIPSLTTLSDTSRLDSDYTFFARLIANMSLWGKEYYRTLLYRFFGNNLQGAGNEFLGDLNYYEAPSVFFSALLIILLIQYVILIARQKTTLLQKLAQYLGIVIGAFILTVQVGSLVFNGFAYAFSRHTFVLMPFFAMICAWTLTGLIRERKISRAGLVIALAVTAAVYIKGYRNYTHPTYETNALILLAAALVMIWALYALGRARLDKAMIIRILTAAVFAGVVCDTALCYRYRSTVKKTDTGYFEETYHGDTVKALDWIESQDNSFYRVEKDYSNAAYYMESLAQDYRGVSTYNSTQSRYFHEFTSKLWPQLYPGYDQNHLTYRSAVHEDVLSALSDVRYLLSHDSKPPTQNWEMIHQEGTVYIFRNNTTSSIGKFYTQTVTMDAFDSARSELDQWDFLPAVLVTQETTPWEIGAEGLDAFKKQEVKAPMDSDRLDLKYYHMLEDGASIEGTGTVILPVDAKKRAACKNMTAQFDITTENAGTLWIYVNDERGYERYNPGTISYRINIPADTEQVTIRAENENLKMTVRNIHFYESSADRDFSDEAVIDLHFEGNDAHLSGTIEAEKDGMVMLAIPMEDGWKVTLDNQEVPLTRADYLYMSFPVTKGSHTVRADYTSPRFVMSAMISLAAFALWLAALAAVYAGSRKKR